MRVCLFALGCVFSGDFSHFLPSGAEKVRELEGLRPGLCAVLDGYDRTSHIVS